MFVRRASVALILASLGAGASVCTAEEASKSRLPVASQNAIVCVRVKSVAGVVDQLDKVARLFDPQMGPMVGMQLKQGLGQLAGIDHTKPMALVLLDPRKYDDPMVGIFHVNDAAAFREKMRADHKHVQGNLGIVSDDEGAAAEVATAVKAQEAAGLFAAGMTDMIVVDADMPALFKRYKMEIQGGLQMLRMKLVGAGGMEAELDEKQQMGVRALDTLTKLVAELEKQTGPVKLGLSLDTTRLTLNTKIEAAAGTEFSQFLKKNAVPAPMVLANYLPKDAYASSIMQFDPASHASLGVGIVEIVCTILGLGADQTGELVAATRKTVSNMTGLQASAAVLTEGGQAGVQLYGIKSQEEARGAMRSWLKFAKGCKLAAEYGLTFSLKEGHRQHGGVPVDLVRVDVDVDKLAGKLPGEAGGKAEMKTAIKQMLKMGYGAEDKVTAEVVYGKRLQVVAYGLGADAVMNRQIDLMKTGGANGLGKSKTYQKALDSQPQNASAYWHFSLFGYADVLGEQLGKMMGPMFGGMNFIPTRQELPKDEVPMSGSVTHSAEASHIAVHVPIKPLADMFKVGKAKFEVMMRERMQGMQPGQPMQ
jgi:hypothetical protein